MKPRLTDYHDSDSNSNDNYTPPEDTTNWESILFESWFPELLRWFYFDFFNSILLKPLGVTKERFQCICGTETTYRPNLDEVGPGTLSVHCSNDLCPMVHRCHPNDRESVLQPRNFIQCSECGDIESEEGYYLRQTPKEKALRRNKWIPDWEEWSDQMGRSSSKTSISDYHETVPRKMPDNLSSVEVIETLCMECWLEDLGADPDRLRQEAKERKASNKLPYHHEERQARKRKRRRRWFRLSALPVGLLLALLVDAAGAVFGVTQQVMLTAVFSLSNLATLSPPVTILGAAELLSFGLSIIGVVFWFHWFFWKFMMVMPRSNT